MYLELVTKMQMTHNHYHILHC